MSIDPTAEDVRKYIDEDDGEPVIMLNLLAFDGEAGRQKYNEYAMATVPHMARVKAELIYFGDTSTALVPDDGHEWDAVILVKYPNRNAFLEMVMDPEYQKISKLRTAALKDAVLQPTSLWTGT